MCVQIGLEYGIRPINHRVFNMTIVCFSIFVHHLTLTRHPIGYLHMGSSSCGKPIDSLWKSVSTIEIECIIYIYKLYISMVSTYSTVECLIWQWRYHFWSVRLTVSQPTQMSANQEANHGCWLAVVQAFHVIKDTIFIKKKIKNDQSLSISYGSPIIHDACPTEVLRDHLNWWLLVLISAMLFAAVLRGISCMFIWDSERRDRVPLMLQGWDFNLAGRAIA